MNNINYKQNQDSDVTMNNMDTSPITVNTIEINKTKGNKLGKLFSQINGGNFRF